MRLIFVDTTAAFTHNVWTRLSTNALTNGTFYFSDPKWTNFAARFYRISTP